MSTLTGGQVWALARQAGFSASESTVATAVARAESGWNTAAVGDTSLANSKWGPSIGLWQVRSLRAQTGTGAARDATRLMDPTFNAAAAYSIYKGEKAGKKWSDWTTFTNGDYRRYLSAAQGGAMAGVTLPSAGASAVTGNALNVNGAGLLDDASGALDNLGGQVGDALTSGLSNLWSQVQPFLVTGAAATLGLALLGAGILVTAWPTTRTTGGL